MSPLIAAQKPVSAAAFATRVIASTVCWSGTDCEEIKPTANVNDCPQKPGMGGVSGAYRCAGHPGDLGERLGARGPGSFACLREVNPTSTQAQLGRPDSHTRKQEGGGTHRDQGGRTASVGRCERGSGTAAEHKQSQDD